VSFACFLSFGVLTCSSVISRKWVSHARSLFLCVLTCLSLCALQLVNPLSCLLSLHTLICPSLYTLLAYLLTFFPCLNLSHSLHSPGSECPLLARFHSLSSDLSLHLCLRSPESECPLLARFHSLSSDLSLHLCLRSPESECPLLARFRPLS